MALYRLTNDPNIIQRTTDSAFIPFDPANSDYQAYLAWLADGNAVDPPKVNTDVDTTFLDTEWHF
jgi:hypothetical protein